jgi:predicted RNA-binding protein YlqC (UPF0109 family)
MRALVEALVKALVDDPASVEITEATGDRFVRFEVRVAPGDAGKVIGRNGRTVRAIRQVVKAAAVRSGCRVSVDIV